ncbi:MAG: methyltransferase domain-containing protein [Geminicoccaceae bacterium]
MGPELPGFVVCPRCHGALEAVGSDAACRSCSRIYPREPEGLCLLADPSDRFDDEDGCGDHANEERSNATTALSYYLPKLRDTLPPGARVLCAGCGVGVDVDLLREAGYDTWGVDCGSRVRHWPQRTCPDNLLVANVKNLPFADRTFDYVKTDCLLPHVGVVGDSTRLGPDWQDARRAVARELLRVTRPGGTIVLANPNRLCPADLFHKGQMREGALARWHWPGERFLLSLGDYRELFRAEGGASAVRALPIAGYWGMHTKRSLPGGRLLVAAADLVFSVVGAPGLRASPLNPWLMVAVQR